MLHRGLLLESVNIDQPRGGINRCTQLIVVGRLPSVETGGVAAVDLNSHARRTHGDPRQSKSCRRSRPTQVIVAALDSIESAHATAGELREGGADARSRVVWNLLADLRDGARCNAAPAHFNDRKELPQCRTLTTSSLLGLRRRSPWCSWSAHTDKRQAVALLRMSTPPPSTRDSLASASPTSKASKNDDLTRSDRTFMTKAVQGGLAEVELGADCGAKGHAFAGQAIRAAHGR